MSEIKPIETHYKEYRFRSRLEARWAVFFDAMGIDWKYEDEGFQLGPFGNYLPDFYIPQFDCFIEVKPTPITKTPCFFAGPIDTPNNYRNKIDLSLLSIKSVGNARCRHDSKVKETVDENLDLICESDIIIAYIDTLDTPGTLLEIGYARGLNKRIIVFISGYLMSDDLTDCYFRGPLWYVEDMATEVYSVSSIEEIQLKLHLLFELPNSIQKSIILGETSGKPVIIVSGSPEQREFSIFGRNWDWAKKYNAGQFSIPFLQDCDQFRDATVKFKRARFEHGECG